ncbi:hypothetical protein [Sphingopyxis witflariensis]|nr:hypothetical protein [Sphingopyxis witflariensis]
MQFRTGLLFPVPATRQQWLAILLGLFALLSALSPANAADRIDVHFFWSAECPHCRDMAASVDAAIGGEGDVTLHRHEVSHDARSAELFAQTVESLDLPAVVPIVLIGREVMVGHEPGASEGLREMINRCRAGPCPDLVWTQTAAESSHTSAPLQNVRHKQASTLRVPWLGEVQISDLSLPALTIAMAAIDGFNPCAMCSRIIS